MPLASVTAVRTFSMSAGLAASTVTPGRTAPELSRTTPAIDACANATDGAATSTATTRHHVLTLYIKLPSLKG